MVGMPFEAVPHQTKIQKSDDRRIVHNEKARRQFSLTKTAGLFYLFCLRADPKGGQRYCSKFHVSSEYYGSNTRPLEDLSHHTHIPIHIHTHTRTRTHAHPPVAKMARLNKGHAKQMRGEIRTG